MNKEHSKGEGGKKKKKGASNQIGFHSKTPGVKKDTFEPSGVFPSLPETLFTPHASFNELNSEQETLLHKQHIHDESLLAQRIFTNFLPDGMGSYDRLIEKDKVLSLEESLSLSEIEIVALTFEHPELLASRDAHGILPTYRLRRSIELACGVPRNHDLVMIGTGVTIPEVVASTLLPPSRDSVESALKNIHEGKTLEDVVSNATTSVEKMLHGIEFKREGVQDHSNAHPPLLNKNGHILAIDPDKNIPEAILLLNRIYKVGVERFHHIQTTLGDFLSTPHTNEMDLSKKWDDISLGKKISQLPVTSEIDLFRFDPKIFSPGNIRRGRDKWLEFAQSLGNHLTEGGHLIISVGTGNTPEDFSSRIAFLGSLEAALTLSGFDIINKSKSPTDTQELGPLFLKNENDPSFSALQEDLFAQVGSGVGHIGALIARKRSSVT